MRETNKIEIKGSEEIDVDYDAINKKISELNRYSFRRTLDEFFKEITFNPKEEDVDRFLKCRNSLVHTGMLICYKEARKKNERCAQEEIYEEFFFLINFLDKIFLKLLSYDGFYSDWSKFPNVQMVCLNQNE